jgi:hypothetical protein
MRLLVRVPPTLVAPYLPSWYRPLPPFTLASPWNLQTLATSKMHISICVWAHFKTPKLFSIYFSSIFVLLTWPHRKCLGNINWQERIFREPRGGWGDNSWLRKVNAASYNNKHQFCKLMWAGCKHFLPESEHVRTWSTPWYANQLAMASSAMTWLPHLVIYKLLIAFLTNDRRQEPK